MTQMIPMAGVKVTSLHREGFGEVPQSVIDAHRPAKPAFERLSEIQAEMKLAASQGNTAKLRSLRSEKRRIETEEQRETARLLAVVRAREIPAPNPAEETQLAARAKELTDEIAKAQARYEKTLARLSRTPESESLLTDAEGLKQRIETARGELQSIQARQQELDRWTAQRARKDEERAKLAEWERDLPKNRARLEVAVRKAIEAWKKLDGTLSEIDGLREQLRHPRRPGDPFVEIYKNIHQRTHGGIAYDGIRWNLTREVKR